MSTVPVDDQFHAQLYSDIRAAVLSRHFAVGRYFWAHHLAPWNWLGSLHGPERSPSEVGKRDAGRDRSRDGQRQVV